MYRDKLSSSWWTNVLVKMKTVSFSWAGFFFIKLVRCSPLHRHQFKSFQSLLIEFHSKKLITSYIWFDQSIFIVKWKSPCVGVKKGGWKDIRLLKQILRTFFWSLNKWPVKSKILVNQFLWVSWWDGMQKSNVQSEATREKSEEESFNFFDT